MPNLIDFSKDFMIPVSLIPLYGPDYLDISAIPKDLKPLAKKILNQILWGLKIKKIKTNRKKIISI